MELNLVASTKMFFLLLALVALASSYVMRPPVEDDYQIGYDLGADFSRPPLKKSHTSEEKDCPIHKIDQLHLVMDRVCEMCHEMFSQTLFNLRAECRDNCFDNPTFKKCIEVFSASKSAPKKYLL